MGSAKDPHRDGKQNPPMDCGVSLEVASLGGSFWRRWSMEKQVCFPSGKADCHPREKMDCPHLGTIKFYFC